MASIEQILERRDRWVAALALGQVDFGFVEASLSGCRDAVAGLETRLAGLGYPVQPILLPCPEDLDERVARLEAHTGIPIPKVLHAFWRIVGGISLVDRDDYQHVAFWEERDIHGRHGFCDGVRVDGCDDDWLDYVMEEYDNAAEDDEVESFLYELSPDGYHKDDISGGLSYALGRASNWGPVWENFTWPGHRRPLTAVPDPTDFVSYLRTAILECAGFPGLLGHPGFEALREDWVRDLPAF